MSEQSPYLSFTRDEWAALRGEIAVPLTEEDLAQLSGIDEALSHREVAEVYLPLSRLLNLHVAAVQDLHRVTSRFLGTRSPRVPYVIAIVGSVAVGKSTTARLLRHLLSRWSDHPRVDLVTTDGFLYPNAVLTERDLMQKKGFPESYDRARLLRFVAELKSGVSPLYAPLYSHLHYDVIAEEQQIDRPDIVIIEGLNVLQSGSGDATFVSDFVDFSIYVDAEEERLERWFLERFRKLRTTAFRDPHSYFHRYAAMAESDAMQIAHNAWDRINVVNLRENILPTRERARLVLVKGEDHVVEEIRLRRL